MSKLHPPDKEPTVRFTVDRSESLQRKLSMLVAKTGARKWTLGADVVRGWAQRGGVDVGFFSYCAIALLRAWRSFFHATGTKTAF